MKKVSFLLLLSGLVFPQVSIKQVNYKGWLHSIQLARGDTKLVIVPGVGGRIMEFSIEGKNPIWQNPLEYGKVYPITNVWHNYGGYKTWNAPQALWGWPPDPFLDYGKANVELLEDGVRIYGAPSLNAGIMFIKEITLPERGKARIVERMRNISGREVRWSIWDVTQVETPCFVVFPSERNSKFPEGLYFFDERSRKSKQWKIKDGLVIVHYEGEVGKIGLDSKAGWMLFLKDSLAYIKRFPVITGQDYPDEGCSVEVYTNSKDLPYLEMEVLSPLVTLKPGEEYSTWEEWYVKILSRPVREEGDIPSAIRELVLAGMLPWDALKFVH
ncbi:MAG: DUF4380 domain-containing protein [bacterium]